jgi:hypothetical protein
MAEMGLARLADALGRRDGAALAELVALGQRGHGRLALDPPWATEGWGIRLNREATVALLDQVLPPSGDPPPVIQGFFGAGCWPHQEPTCALQLVVTGLRSGVTMPDRASGETIGPLPPDLVPTVAAWHLLPDGAGGLGWRGWRAAQGAGYGGLLAALAEGGWGTYYVLR